MQILAEALEGYELDGLFFNMFGNQNRDYSGRFVGHCRCDSCQRKYRQMFGKDIPKEPDSDYARFMFISSREVAAEIGRLIRAKRPAAGYFNYIQEYTDGIMSESNTALTRPLPLWPYASSDNVNRARNSEPSKMSVNLNMQFVDFPWRFATVPRNEIALRLWQNLAHGGALAFAVNGTLDQQDRQAVETARPIFQWAATNEQLYSSEESAARIVLLGAAQGSGRSFNQASYRGMFRLLSEEHLPFAAVDNVRWIGARPVDLAIATDWAPPELGSFVEAGGSVLLVSARPPEFKSPAVKSTVANIEGYVRVRKPASFPSLSATTLLMLNGPFTEVQADAGAPALTLVPPSMFGPPEKIHVDIRDTDTPALVEYSIGKGKVVWVPWDAAGLYYKHSLPAHAGLLKDLIDRLMPERQIRTNAHPLVEMSLMRQGRRTLLHLVNLSGHSQTGYFDPIPMRDIRVDVEGVFMSARTHRVEGKLEVERTRRRTSFVMPVLNDYEVISLE